jgi:hypothetical protein
MSITTPLVLLLLSSLLGLRNGVPLVALSLLLLLLLLQHHRCRWPLFALASY